MANPFDDPEANFKVLVNDFQQHSLWPADMNTPRGWVEAFGPAEKDHCLDYVRENWVDMTPRRVSNRGDTQVACA